MISKDNYVYTHAKKLSWSQASVHYGNTKRFDKAEEQNKFACVEIYHIIKLTNDFLEKVGIRRVKNPLKNNFTVLDNEDKTVNLDYERIKNEYGLNNTKHIIWMKFTTDGYLGVVASSDDINFGIPNNSLEYNEKKNNNQWKYNTSGIIIHYLEKVWDESFVLVFPLPNIGDGERSDIECGVGNYLISKGVPILDYYSHMF